MGSERNDGSIEANGWSEPSGLISFVFERPWLAVAIVVAICLTCIGLRSQVKVASGISTFHAPAPEIERTIREVNDTFINTESILIFYRAEEPDDIFSRRHLQNIRELTKQLEDVTIESSIRLEKGMGFEPESESSEFRSDDDESRRKGSSKTESAPEKREIHPIADVWSLTNADVLLSTSSRFRADPLVPDPIPSEKDRLAEIKDRARSNPLLAEGFLPRSHSKATAIVGRFPSNAEIDDEFRAATTEKVRSLVAEFENREDFAGDLAVIGRPVVRTGVIRQFSGDMKKIVPMMFAIMITMLALFFRRWRGVVYGFATIFASILVAQGAIALVAGQISTVLMLLRPLVLTLTVPIVLHYFTEYGHFGRTQSHEAAARSTLNKLFVPVLFTSLTTAAGFGALGTSVIPTVRNFGLAACLALLVIFVTATLAASAAMKSTEPDDLISEKGLALSERYENALSGLADIVIARPLVWCIGTGGIAVAFAVGIAFIHVEQNTVTYFDEDTRVRQATEKFERNLGGTLNLVFSIRHNEPEKLIEPEVLRRVDAFTADLRNEMGFSRVSSYSMFVKYMHRQFLGGDEGDDRLPDNRQQTAQLLSMNGADVLYDYLNEERNWARIVVRTREDGLNAVRKMYNRVESELEKRFPEESGFEVAGTGRNKLTSHSVHRLLDSQIKSLLLGVLIIFVLITVLFRSVRVTVLSILPNLMPVAVVLGIMGWFGINLSVPTVLMAAMTLGVAVDDTIHFITHLRRQFRRHGDHERAVRETMAAKGPAILGTTLVIACGFLVFLTASFAPVTYFGWIIATAMVVAAAGDLITLPALFILSQTTLGFSEQELSE